VSDLDPEVKLERAYEVLEQAGRRWQAARVAAFAVEMETTAARLAERGDPRAGEAQAALEWARQRLHFLDRRLDA
jgi:ribose 1,5-bisphosphokinase PhnN